MATRIAHLAIATLAGASLTALAFTATPLRAHHQAGWTPRWESMNANRWQGPHSGPGAGGMPCINGGVSDPATLETLEGTATQVNQYSGHQGRFLTLQTDQETIEVHLGPAWYLDRQGFEISLNSPIEVTVFRNTFNNQAVLMASEVKQGDQVLQLRDDNGHPLWMGQGFPAN